MGVMFLYIIAALIAFGFLVFFHELGHFTLAKLNGVKIDEFAIGMGPKLFGIKGKETLYSIRILPIGGYVKMLGEEEKSEDPRAFNNKSPLRKLSIVIAGPIMNLILAVVLFCIIGAASGIVLPKVNVVEPKSAAEDIGVKAGDELLKVNGNSILTWEDFSLYIALAKNNPINLTVNRSGKTINYTVKPKYNKEEKRYLVGVSPIIIKNPTLVQSITNGFKQTISMINQALLSFKLLFTGKVSTSDVGGPVTIIKMTGAAAKAGILSLLTIVAFLSTQLGVINLLPFPALDGGFVFLYLFQIITGKKVDDNKVGVVTTIGFTILMGLMVVVVLKDILYPINF